MKKILKNEKFVYYSLAVLVGILCTIWILKSKLIISDDIRFHLSRIEGLKNSILNGDWLAYIHDGLFGYGYANGMFYGNLLLYFPALLCILGIPIAVSYKIFICVCSILSSVFMFTCLKKIIKNNKISLFGTILYSFSSYRTVDFLVRSAIGEVGAIVIIPILLLGLYEMLYGNYKKGYLFAIAFAILLQCHIISTIIFFSVSCLIIILSHKHILDDKKRIKYFICNCVLTILLSLSFLLPFLEGYIQNDLLVKTYTGNYIGFRAVDFVKIFLGITTYTDDSAYFPPGLGLAFIIVLFLRFKIKNKDKDELLHFSDILMIVGIIYWLCVTNIFPWDVVPFVGIIQFPWRLYIVPILLLAVSDSIILYYYLKDKSSRFCKSVLIPLILLSIIPYFILVVTHMDAKRFDYTSNDYSISSGEYLPINANIKAIEERGDIVTSNNEIDIEFVRDKNKVIVNYTSNNYDDTFIEVPFVYYKGYVAKTDNQYLDPASSENGLVKVNLKDKEGKIEIYYKYTNIQIISIVISLLSWIMLLIYLVREKVKSDFSK